MRCLLVVIVSIFLCAYTYSDILQTRAGRPIMRSGIELDTGFMTVSVIDPMIEFSGVNIEESCITTDPTVLDSNFIIHFRTVDIPGGWPHLTDSVTCYWDTDDKGAVLRGFDSARVCSDGTCDSVTKLWTEPHRYWGVGTPYGFPGTHPGACEENPNVFCSDDFKTWRNRIGAQPGDTISNPIAVRAWLEFAEEDTFFYHDPDGSGGISAYPIDTGSVDHYADSAVPGTKFECLHLADPDIFLDAENRLWVVWIAVYGGGFYYSEGNIVWAAVSSNGFDWSSYYQITHMGDYVSPSIITDGADNYDMFVRNGRRDAYHDHIALYRFSTDSIETIWSRSGVTTVGGDTTDRHIYASGDTALIWHFDIARYHDDQWTLIYSGKNARIGTNDSTIGFCVSDNRGANFNCVSRPLWHRGGSQNHYYAPSGYFMADNTDTVFRAPITYHEVGNDRWYTQVWDIDFELNWVPGDVNADFSVSVGDAVMLIDYIFKGGYAPIPLKIGDVNGNCLVDVADAVYLIRYVFQGGAAPLVGCAEE